MSVPIDYCLNNLTEKLAQNLEVRNVLRKHRMTEKLVSRKLADSLSVYDIGNVFIVLVSPLSFPEVAANEARAIRLARQFLPSNLSSFSLDIIAQGHLDDGRSFVVMPRGTSLSENRIVFSLQKRHIKPVVLEWLRGLARVAAPPSDETCAEFQASLESLAAMNNPPAPLLTAVREGLTRLSKGSFVARHCPMHGDLWRGNIIYGPDKSIKAIDWRGSRMDGYGFFDLVKFAQSFNIKAEDLRRETIIHACSLGIDVKDAPATLLACCGYISRNLGEFPLDNFMAMTSSLYNFLQASIA